MSRAVAMNWRWCADAFEREETPYTLSDVLAGTMEAGAAAVAGAAPGGRGNSR